MEINDIIEKELGNAETEHVEYKSAKGGFPGSFWETYAAMANTDGGVIVLGVKEKNGGFSYDGLDDASISKYKKEFWNTVNNKNKVNVNLLKNDDVREFRYRDKRMLLFCIPRAAREQSPVYCNGTPVEGTFKRNNEGDYKCTEPEVRRMFADADLSSSADARILDNYSWDDIDVDSFRQFRQIFAVVKPVHPWQKDSDKALMTHLGGYRKDRQTGKEGFTLAGLLMFGKWESITDPACCPQYMVDYREEPDDNSKIRWTDRVYPDGTWVANIFQFYRIVLPKLQNFIPKPFRMVGYVRVDNGPANDAIREAFVNCLVHASYATESSLVVKKMHNAIIFSNPGTLLITKAQYYAGGESVCRNPILQKMFMMLGDAEKAGGGAEKILSGWREMNMRKPQLIESQRPDKVILTLPLESMMREDTLFGLNRRFGGEALSSLNYNELNVLACAETGEAVTHDTLLHIVDLHKADLSALLHKLCGSGFLRSQGRGRGTQYYLADWSVDPEAKGASSAAKGASSAAKGASSEDEGTGSVAEGACPWTKVASSETKVASSETKVASSGTKVASSGTKVASSETKVASSELRRINRSELEQEIITCCCEWRNISDIVAYVGKSRDYLRNKVINVMVREGMLEQQYPENKTHPNQKYRNKR